MMQNLIALAIVGVTAVWLVRHFARVAKSGSCGSGCDSAKGNRQGKKAPRRALKQTPLVPPEQIGLPPSSGESPVDD